MAEPADAGPVTCLDFFPADILRMTLTYLDVSYQIISYLSHSKDLLSIRLEMIWKQYWDYRISQGMIIPCYTCHELMFAMAEFGHFELLKKLIDTRIGLNPGEFYFRPCTPFHIAAKYGRRKIVSFLLDRRVDIDLTDRLGLTALHYAVENGDVKMTKMLLDRKANPYIMSNDSQPKIGRLTPIGYAILKNQPEIIRLFCAYTCTRKIDLTRDCGYLKIMGTTRELPPLHYAAVSGNVQMLQVLLECGLDPDRRADGYAYRLSPLHALVQYGLNLPWKQVSSMIPRYIEIIELLIQHGADLSMWTPAPNSGLKPTVWVDDLAVPPVGAQQDRQPPECKRPIDLLTKNKRMDPRVYEMLTPKI